MKVPESYYGVLEQDGVSRVGYREAFDEAVEPAHRRLVESIREEGFAIWDPGLSADQIDHLGSAFDRAHEAYIEKHGGTERLASLAELNIVRAMLTDSDPVFLRLALNTKLLKLIGSLISGKFILNQQNGIINPPLQSYSQAHWHRDLPYQHFTSSRPLAINALFCLDEFIPQNGATYVLPGSHRSEGFPAWGHVREKALQVSAPRGFFIILDCMTFHAGGYNSTSRPRRAINHVYNIPFFKQQIGLGEWAARGEIELDAQAREVLGLRYREPQSVEAYIGSRARS